MLKECRRGKLSYAPFFNYLIVHEAKLKLRVKSPLKIARSLKPDLSRRKGNLIKIESKKRYVVIEVKSEKMSHLKGIINTYISLVSMLDEIDGVM